MIFTSLLLLLFAFSEVRVTDFIIYFTYPRGQIDDDLGISLGSKSRSSYRWIWRCPPFLGG